MLKIFQYYIKMDPIHNVATDYANLNNIQKFRFLKARTAIIRAKMNEYYGIYDEGDEPEILERALGEIENTTVQQAIALNRGNPRAFEERFALDTFTTFFDHFGEHWHRFDNSPFDDIFDTRNDGYVEEDEEIEPRASKRLRGELSSFSRGLEDREDHDLVTHEKVKDQVLGPEYNGRRITLSEAQAIVRRPLQDGVHRGLYNEELTEEKYREILDFVNSFNFKGGRKRKTRAKRNKKRSKKRRNTVKRRKSRR